MHFETHAIHTGQHPEPHTGAVIPPIYATSTFAQIGPGETRGFDYTRSGNPNFSNLEKTLAALENAQYATVFGSGMAAVTAVISSLDRDSVVVAEENVYGCTYRIYAQVFEKFGIQVKYFDLSNPENYSKITEIKPTLVWIESPTNPMLKILDIAALSKVADEAGSTLVMDNTFASPYNQRPLDLGAHICLASTTKYINGHSDCLGGVVCTNSEEWYGKMVFQQKAVGLNPSPFDAWLISRGVKTLALRMEKHQQNALEIAQYLEAHDAVEWVRYPFLPSHPQHELAKKQMRGGSGIVTVNFKLSLEQTKAVISGFKLFSLAESLGGVESLVCHPASMTHSSIPKEDREKVGITDGLVRFSLGIEHHDDLLADIKESLNRVLNQG